jgi:DNA-binding transcriptional LysR family regulator
MLVIVFIAFINIGFSKESRMRTRDAALLDVKALQLLEAVYETRSITRAAERLGLSQPTLSIGLGALRRKFHDPLFVRTPDGMQPTPQADALIGRVRQTLQSLLEISEWKPTFDPATSERNFRISMTDASHITLLPQLLSHARVVAPHVQIEAARIDETLPHALQSGEVDLALGFITTLSAGFYEQTLYSQDWICLTQANHPRIRKRKMTLQAYRAEAHISIVGGTGQHLLEEALKKQNIERRILLKLPGFLGLAGILQRTDLVATLPRHIGGTLATLGNLNVHDCPVRVPTFTVKQHWHARYHHDAANRWLRGICAELFRP